MSRSIIIDSTLCIDCHTCEAAYSEAHRQYSLQSISRLRAMLNEKESVPQLYHHCEDAPYTVVCPVNAITRVDGAVQLNESLCISCKLYGTACPFGIIEFSGSRPLDIPANVDTPKMPPAPSAPMRVSTLLGWVSGIRVIAVGCDLCGSDEQDPACVRMYLTKILHLVDNTDIACVSKRKRELTFSTDFGDLTLFQQAQSGEAK